MKRRQHHGTGGHGDGHSHEGHDEHSGHDGHGHDGRDHGHGEEHLGHGHERVEKPHEQVVKPPRKAAALEPELAATMLEAQEHFGTERGTRSYERLVAALTGPAMRIARFKMEDMLPSHLVDLDHINDIVYEALFHFYENLHLYRPGTPVIPWFATMVRNKTIDFVRREYHTRAKHRLEFEPYDETTFPVAEREDDVHTRLDIQQVLHGLSAEEHEVATLLDSGHSTEEIAVALGRSEAWVRARRKALRVEFGALL